MNIYSVFSFVSFLICFFLGFHLLLINRKPLKNKIFILSCAMLAVSSFLAVFVYSAASAGEAKYYYKLSIIFFYAFIAFFVLFNVILTDIIKINRFTLFIIIFPSLLFIIRELFSSVLYVYFEKINGVWVFTPDVRNAWYFLYIIYTVSCLGLSVFLTFYWKVKDRSYKVKKQSHIIFISLFIFSAAGVLNDFILNALIKKYPVPPLAPSLLIIWLLGIWFSIVKFRLMSMTEEKAHRYILESSDEFILLIDEKFQIIDCNAKSKEILKNFKKSAVEEIFYDKAIIKRIVSDLFEFKKSYASIKTTIWISENKKGAVDVVFTPVKDEYKDNIGILIRAKEIKGVEDFLNRYKITDREFEIIENIISGRKNREIAESLCITEKTIDAHITHIYNKLGINNKVQLLSFIMNIEDLNGKSTAWFIS